MLSDYPRSGKYLDLAHYSRSQHKKQHEQAIQVLNKELFIIKIKSLDRPAGRNSVYANPLAI